ncbi:MAG: hypothetical protein LBM20_08135 [Rikenellaceae bacterium]|nr:hypothetical protein [Rikenellaceae bacterium]
MKRIRSYRTDFLFPKSSFLIGAGSILALGGNYYRFNGSSTDAEADARALRSDWGVVANDFCEAFKQFDSAHKKRLKK